MYYIFVSGLDFVRLILGPLPTFFCTFNYIVRNLSIGTFYLLSIFYIILKFHFICVWKHLKIINDNLLTRIVLVIAFFISLWLSIVKMLSPGEKHITYVSTLTDDIKGGLNISLSTTLHFLNNCNRETTSRKNMF